MAIKNDFDTKNMSQMHRQSSVFIAEFEGIGADSTEKFERLRKDTLMHPTEFGVDVEPGDFEDLDPLADIEDLDEESEDSSDDNSRKDSIPRGRDRAQVVLTMSDIDELTR